MTEYELKSKRFADYRICLIEAELLGKEAATQVPEWLLEECIAWTAAHLEVLLERKENLQ